MKQQDRIAAGKLVLIHGGLAAVIGFAVCCLLAAAVLQEWIPVQMGKTAALLLSNGGLGLLCWGASKKMPSNRLLVSLAVTVVYWVLCFLGKAALFSGTPIRPNWNMAVPFIAALLAGMVASMEKSRRR